MSGEHRNDSVTKFRWAVVAGLIALVMVLGTISDLVRPG